MALNVSGATGYLASLEYKVGRKIKFVGKELYGEIAYYGTTKFAPELWIGVKLNEPRGKNNGTVNGVDYFKCEEKHGLFVKPSQVQFVDSGGKPIDDPPKLRRQSSTGIARPRMTTSRMSLSASRQSLSGSRQSLSGSRSQLSLITGPDHEPPPSQIPKRASFIETGFVETMKPPQYTPGQVLTTAPTPVQSIDEKISMLQLQQELTQRQAQIKDLGEKLETLRIKRQEDKEKLKELDKLRIQYDQLVEFKTKIMEAQTTLQRDLQRARQETKDAIEAKEQHAEEVADLAEAVEMATLDKEMAEEKAETLQLELEVCRERLEEVTLDLEILKTEMNEKVNQSEGNTTDAGAVAISTFEMKQLQQQNSRLRETLVRLRDLSAHDKHEYQKLAKDIEQKKSEITELGKTKEKLSARVDEMERQISDLQEQVDAALGAEEMVVLLGEQKLTLEERVHQLEDEVAELEALQEMNDELMESNAELEADLREELDMAHNAVRMARRDRDAALETIADREMIISKFRELVSKLREHTLDLERKIEAFASDQSTSGGSGSMGSMTMTGANKLDMHEFQKMFQESRAHTKAVDLELRRAEVQQYQKHIQFLQTFMPDTFMQRGGDHDAILVLLLVPRMLRKCELIMSHVQDRFGVQGGNAAEHTLDRTVVLKGHKCDQIRFRTKISFYLFTLEMILHQYQHALDNCSNEVLQKVGGTHSDMAIHERIIDGFVELLKRDQLDENVQMDMALEKCINFFWILFNNNVYQNANVDILSQLHLCQDFLKWFACACGSYRNDVAVIKVLLENSNTGDVVQLCQMIRKRSDQLLQLAKQIKRRFPTPAASPLAASGLGTDLGIVSNTWELLHSVHQHSLRILRCLNDITKHSVLTITSGGDSDEGLTTEKMKDIAYDASDRVYEQDDLGPLQSIKGSLDYIEEFAKSLNERIANHQSSAPVSGKSASANSDTSKLSSKRAIELRAIAVKQELEQTTALKSKLRERETDIIELRRLIKEKQEDLNQMTIRKERLENKLANISNDYAQQKETLQRKLEEAQNTLKMREKEFEDTLDHLQADIDELEMEKGEYREKLKLLKKVQMDPLYSHGSSMVSMQGSTTSLGGGPTLSAPVRDSPWLLQEIAHLRKLFLNERNERLKQSTDETENLFNSLTDIPNLHKQHSAKDDNVNALIKEGRQLKNELLLLLVKPTVPRIKSTFTGSHGPLWRKHMLLEADKVLCLQRKVEDYQNKVLSFVIKYGSNIKAPLAVFPTVHMAKAITERDAKKVGFVRMPKQLVGMKRHEVDVVDVKVNLEQLNCILQSLINF